MDERCSICNEHFKNRGFVIRCCRWDHIKSPCQFCNLPINHFLAVCKNYHIVDNLLCKECNMPEGFNRIHEHDGTLCKKCGTLLNHGRCIYQCVNGGNRCVHCYWEGVVNNRRWNCGKDQTGFLTKAATK